MFVLLSSLRPVSRISPLNGTRLRVVVQHTLSSPLPTIHNSVATHDGALPSRVCNSLAACHRRRTKVHPTLCHCVQSISLFSILQIGDSVNQHGFASSSCFCSTFPPLVHISPPRLTPHRLLLSVLTSFNDVH
jgi:hypothetical protein